MDLDMCPKLAGWHHADADGVRLCRCCLGQIAAADVLSCQAGCTTNHLLLYTRCVMQPGHAC
jgi:hypothetical protein